MAAAVPRCSPFIRCVSSHVDTSTGTASDRLVSIVDQCRTASPPPPPPLPSEQRFLRNENLAVNNQTQSLRPPPSGNETAFVPPNNVHVDHRHLLGFGMALLLLLLLLSGSVVYVRHKHHGINSCRSSSSPGVSAAFVHARRHVRRSVYQQKQCRYTHGYALRTPQTAMYRVVAAPHGPLPKHGSTTSTAGTSGHQNFVSESAPKSNRETVSWLHLHFVPHALGWTVTGRESVETRHRHCSTTVPLSRVWYGPVVAPIG
jgi:hypothetical protein